MAEASPYVGTWYMASLHPSPEAPYDFGTEAWLTPLTSQAAVLEVRPGVFLIPSGLPCLQKVQTKASKQTRALSGDKIPEGQRFKAPNL